MSCKYVPTVLVLLIVAAVPDPVKFAITAVLPLPWSSAAL
jgi:hypothetical protein